MAKTPLSVKITSEVKQYQYKIFIPQLRGLLNKIVLKKNITRWFCCRHLITRPCGDLVP